MKNPQQPPKQESNPQHNPQKTIGDYRLHQAQQYCHLLVLKPKISLTKKQRDQFVLQPEKQQFLFS
jgi:uncharacterized protein YciW